MKTLKNNLIVYDKDCPMCEWYTGLFTKNGFLENNGRTTYTALDAQTASLIDMHRAKTEIALVDKERKQVTYGIDSMIKVFSHGKPLLNKVLHSVFIYPFAKFFYLLISYNRKMIAPSANMYEAFDCSPAYNGFFRWFYILLTGISTAFILNQYSTHLFAVLEVQTKFWFELSVVIGQLAFQGVFIGFIHKEKRMDYLGNMMTVSFIGAILLVPMLLLIEFSSLTGIFALPYFGSVVAFMLYLHYNRCKTLKLGWRMTFSWVLYRILVLTLILLVL